MSQVPHTRRRTMRLADMLTWCSDGNSRQDGLIDLLTDAMHWCDQNGEDFHITLAQACHYINELNGDQQDERRLDMQPVSPGNRPLPPDPEGINDDRAEWVGYALAAFVSQTGTDSDAAATDLLCDLMHLADRDGTDFALTLDRARRHYAFETASRESNDSPHLANRKD